MTYHNALVVQLNSLVELIQSLRRKLQSSDDSKIAMEVCKLTRRRDNLLKVLHHLECMTVVNKTDRTIREMLHGGEFAGKIFDLPDFASTFNLKS